MASMPLAACKVCRFREVRLVPWIWKPETLKMPPGSPNAFCVSMPRLNSVTP